MHLVAAAARRRRAARAPRGPHRRHAQQQVFAHLRWLRMWCRRQPTSSRPGSNRDCCCQRQHRPRSRGRPGSSRRIRAAGRRGGVQAAVQHVADGRQHRRMGAAGRRRRLQHALAEADELHERAGARQPPGAAGAQRVRGAGAAAHADPHPPRGHRSDAHGQAADGPGAGAAQARAAGRGARLHQQQRDGRLGAANQAPRPHHALQGPHFIRHGCARVCDAGSLRAGPVWTCVLGCARWGWQPAAGMPEAPQAPSADAHARTCMRRIPLPAAS